MDLDFSEEQDILREMVRSLCSEHSTIEVVRAMEDDPKGYPDELWKQRALVVVIPAIVTTAFVGMLVELHPDFYDVAAIFCKLSVFYICMSLTVSVANAFVTDDYRSGLNSSGLALVGVYTAATLTGVVIGAELAMALHCSSCCRSL